MRHAHRPVDEPPGREPDGGTDGEAEPPPVPPDVEEPPVDLPGREDPSPPMRA